jgi:hypothetical protein
MSDNLRRWPAVMVDLETLGTSANAAVIEIGAVCFDLETREMGPKFEAKISLTANGLSGRTIEAETLAWWMARWRDSGKVPDLSEGNTVEGAFWDLLEFWREHAAPAAEFWSRGSFDEVILRDMGVALGGVPWKYWQARDQRTVLKWEKVNTYGEPAHTALEDAVGQVGSLFGVLAIQERQPRQRAEQTPATREEVFADLGAMPTVPPEFRPSTISHLPSPISPQP